MTELERLEKAIRGRQRATVRCSDVARLVEEVRRLQRENADAIMLLRRILHKQSQSVRLAALDWLERRGYAGTPLGSVALPDPPKEGE